MESILCPNDHELLDLVAGGAVPDSLHRHVDACGACRLRVDRLRAEVAAVRQVTDELPAAAGAGLIRELPPAETPSWPSGTEPAAESSTSPGPMALEHPPRPESIGRYRIVGELDSGGQASVYRAVHPTLRSRSRTSPARSTAASSGETRSSSASWTIPTWCASMTSMSTRAARSS